jgi:hypothetical protein
MKLIPLLRVAVMCALCAGLTTGCRTRRPDETEPTLIPTHAAQQANSTQTSSAPAPTAPPAASTPTPAAADPATRAQGEAAEQDLQDLDTALSQADTLDDLANDPGEALLQGLEQLEPTLQAVDTVNDLK